MREKNKPRRRMVMMEAVEGRRLFTVTLLNTPSNVTVDYGTTNTAVSAGNLFSTDATANQVVRFVMQRGTGASAVTNNLDIGLYDTAYSTRSAATATVNNFLNYVTSGRYSNSVFHRSLNFSNNTLPAQFLQGGGFTTDSAGTLSNITTDAPIALDYKDDRLNVAGTIAMARTGSLNTTTATSGFFFNTQDNSGIFNAGNPYAVFGQVLGNGLQLLSDLSNLTRITASVPFKSGTATVTQSFPGFPVYNYPSGTTPAPGNYVSVVSASVVTPAHYLTYQVSSSDASKVSARLADDGTVQLTGLTDHAATVTITVQATDLSGATNQTTYQATVPPAKIAIKVNNSEVSSTVTSARNLGLHKKGDATTATLTVLNSGGVPLNVSAIDVPSGFSLSGTFPLAVPVGGSTDLTLTTDTSTTGVKGATFVVHSDDANTPAFNVTVTTAIYQPVMLDNKTIKSVVFTESDGTKGTLTLTGAGNVEADFIGLNTAGNNVKGVFTLVQRGVIFQGLTLTGTNSKSIVTLTAAGKNKQIDLQDVTLTGAKSAVGTLDLAPAVISDSLTLGGSVASVIVGGLMDADVMIGAPSVAGKPKIQLALGVVKNSFMQVETNGIISISASSMDSMDLISRVRLDDLSVKGTVTGSQIEAGAVLGSLTAGRLLKSSILVGTAGTGMDGGAVAPTSKADLGKGSIGNVTVTGKAASFSGTVIAAAKLGNLSLGLLPTSSASMDTIIGDQVLTLAGKVGSKSFSLTGFNDPKSLAAVLKKAKVTLPSGLMVTIY